jgi:hypothetical protein
VFLSRLPAQRHRYTAEGARALRGPSGTDENLAFFCLKAPFYSTKVEDVLLIG